MESGVPTCTVIPETLVRPPTADLDDYGHCSDDDSDKGSSGTSALNKNVLRCLLLLLPVAIPVVVYLKDIDATRRIFLAVFVLFLVLVLSCMLMALLRNRRRQLENAPSHSEIARELAHRHLVSVTHRLLPRTFPPGTRCQVFHGEVAFADFRRPMSSLRPSNSHTLPVHYHLAPNYSRSPSPRRVRPLSPVRSECGRLGISPSYSPMHLFRSLSHPSVDTCCPEARLHSRDDPPSYEDALNYPLASTHRKVTLEALAETPPPTYDRAVP